jgi:hypothetical protein
MVFARRSSASCWAHEVLVLPPAAEEAIAELEDVAARRCRSTPSGATCGWSSAWRAAAALACVLALRGATPEQDERLTGPDLVPRLAAALLATLEEA